MPRPLRILFTGLFISFLGSLPLGTINIAALQISLSQGLGNAILFITGALVAEMFYVRLSLIAMDWIRKRAKLLKAFEAVTFLIVLAWQQEVSMQPGREVEMKIHFLNLTCIPFFLGS
jgi:threonine/homoserine/homoserine lactone efflux protein